METDWQLNCRKINERGKELLANGKCTDCEFIVGVGDNQEVIGSHKVLLAMSSPVFESMLFGSFQEKGEGPIALPDVQPTAFKSLLLYIYTDSFVINSIDEACGIYYIANKYMYPFVVEQCRQFLTSKLSPKTACHIYEIANLFDETSLAEACLKVICTETMAVLWDNSFEEILLSTLMLILKQDKLEIDSELSLFRAVERFSKNLEQRECNGENTNLRDAINLIRFLMLSPQEFATIACSTLLTRDESFAIFMNISSSRVAFPMPEGFSKSKNSRKKIFIDFKGFSNVNPVTFNINNTIKFSSAFPNIKQEKP